MLSKRLQTILSLIVPDSQSLIDVGTDHGQLPIYAIKNKIVKKVYATDLRDKPLKMAEKNIKKYNLEKEIQVIKANGLTFLSKIQEKEIDYCVIAGMGTKSILEILKNDSSKINNYLLCSNSEVENLRKWANQNQITISHEEFLVENDRHYWIFLITKNRIFLPCKNEKFGDFVWHKDNLNYQKYLQKMWNFNLKIINQVDDLVIKKEFAIKNQQIQEYLQLWN